jgi:hypothetical protein
MQHLFFHFGASSGSFCSGKVKVRLLLSPLSTWSWTFLRPRHWVRAVKHSLLWPGSRIFHLCPGLLVKVRNSVSYTEPCWS